METNRKKDSSQEQLVTAWISKYFFSRQNIAHEVVTDKQRQIDGIDIVASGRNIDLKAQSSRKYLNNPRATFSFEVSFYDKSDKLRYGWFVSKKKTDDYALIWIPSAEVDDEGYLKDEESINSAMMMFVGVDDIRNYVAKYATALDLLSTADCMRANATRREDVSEDMHLTYTDSLAEQPVNLVIAQGTIAKLARSSWYITKNGVAKLK